MREVDVVGVGMTPFTRRTEEPSSVLAARAVETAVADAGITWADVEHLSVGAVGVALSAAPAVLDHLPPTGVGAVALENASATGSSAFAHAVALVASGAVEVAAAVGYGSLEALLPTGAVRSGPFDLAHASGLDLPPVVFALVAAQRAVRYGAEAASTTGVVIKNRRNAAANPLAQRRRAVTAEDVDSSPVIASPLRVVECCPMGDGAAAVVVAAAGVRPRGVGVLASVTTTDLWHGAGGWLPDPGITARTVERALRDARVGPSNLDVVEVHDAFAVEELEYVEAIGLCSPGRATEAVAAGDFDIGGRVAVSPSGGLLGRGHPGGATGMAQVVEIVDQLRGESGPRQQPGARVGLAHMIGAGGVCVVHVLGHHDRGTADDDR
jgi:acetyl-CoA acetyltransferase